MTSAARYRVGVDVGGTHTDMVLVDTQTGSYRVEKLPSSLHNQSVAVLEGLRRFLASGIAPEEIGTFAHGTTVTTNALLEMKGARVGVLINARMRGILEVQTQGRDGVSPFDHFFQRPEPLARSKFVREIGGRIDYQGVELEQLDEDAVRSAARELLEQGVTSFAICFLFSFMNPAHEASAAAIIKEIAPQAFVSRSSAVLPRIREWPRFSTTLLNAYLAPALARYCGDLADGLDSIELKTLQRFLMQSNGGVMPLRADAETHTVRTLLSGPAAGVRGAAVLLGKEQGWSNIITMDIGGTSCDIAFIENGEPHEQSEGLIDGRIVGVPALDVVTIPAGGGSVARVSAGGMLEVGPRSMGAKPGPACYGRGGETATVTDADVICGALNPDYFLGGRATLDLEAARNAIQNDVAAPMGVDVVTAAAGIVRMVNAHIVDAIRVEAAKRGIDLTGFTLVPFGGAGPVHAAQVAHQLGIPRVLSPPNPGAFSALGLLCTDVQHDYLRSTLCDMAGLDVADVNRAYEDLRAQALRELAQEGVAAEGASFIREMDLRYAGQGYELRVSVDGLGEPLQAGDLAAMVSRFHMQHESQHGHCARDARVELVSYRLRALAPMPKYRSRKMPAKRMNPPPRGERTLILSGEHCVQAAIWRREDLHPGWTTQGPCIIEQADSTTVAPPGWNVRCDDYGNLLIERAAP
jgi:N-methylhydantoinase A